MIRFIEQIIIVMRLKKIYSFELILLQISVNKSRTRVFYN